MKGTLITLLATLCLVGCVDVQRGPYTARSELTRDTHKAEMLNRKAADLILKDPQKAEKLLGDALTADLYCGPAHNNLGIIYLNSGRLYEAAGEFEWARRVMPGHAEPRTNLALTLEQAGRFDEAIEAYHSALSVSPHHVRSMEGLALLQIRHGLTDETTAELLDEIAMRGETAHWRSWARQQATLLSP